MVCLVSYPAWGSGVSFRSYKEGGRDQSLEAENKGSRSRSPGLSLLVLVSHVGWGPADGEGSFGRQFPGVSRRQGRSHTWGQYQITLALGAEGAVLAWTWGRGCDDDFWGAPKSPWE